MFGKNYIEFGEAWRIGQTTKNTLSLSNNAIFTALLWTGDGKAHGKRRDYLAFGLKSG